MRIEDITHDWSQQWFLWWMEIMVSPVSMGKAEVWLSLTYIPESVAVSPDLCTKLVLSSRPGSSEIKGVLLEVGAKIR